MTVLQAFDEMSEEIIHLSRVIAPIEGFPETVIVTYSRLKLDYLRQHYRGDRIATLNAACDPIPTYRTEHEGSTFATYHSRIGGPAASGIMEEGIAFGLFPGLACSPPEGLDMDPESLPDSVTLFPEEPELEIRSPQPIAKGFPHDPQNWPDRCWECRWSHGSQTPRSRCPADGP